MVVATLRLGIELCLVLLRSPLLMAVGRNWGCRGLGHTGRR